MSNQTRAPIRILVADDEPEILAAYREIFTSVEEATGASQRRQLAARLFDGAGATAAPPVARFPPRASFEADYCSSAEAAVAAVQAALDAGRPYAIVFLDMRTELFPKLPVRTLREQMQIEIAEEHAE